MTNKYGFEVGEIVQNKVILENEDGERFPVGTNLRQESKVNNMKPKFWFKTIEELTEINCEPQAIEYLKMDTGETFVHLHGTAFWNSRDENMNLNMLKNCGITHWRILDENKF